jgi:glycerophosphoryl diester phosphodiesterase
MTGVFDQVATIVGHRGLGQGLVDGFAGNSLGSFLAAVDAGVDWVEVDVQRASDDVLFVHHDASLADGRALSATSSSELSRLGVLRVVDALQALPAHVGVVFDVKSTIDDAERDASSTTGALLARTCVECLGDRRSLAMSFDPSALVHMRDIAPALPLGLLTWTRFPIGHAVAAAAHLNLDVLAVHAGSMWANTESGLGNQPLTADVVERIHMAGRQFVVWCPSLRRAKSLAGAGVDAMIVDDVGRHLRALTTSGSSPRPGQ